MERTHGAFFGVEKSSTSVWIRNLAEKTRQAFLNVEKSLACLFEGKPFSK